MSSNRGRPPGVLNKPGHAAGGARQNSGRKPAGASKSQGIPTMLPNLSKSSTNFYPIFNAAKSQAPSTSAPQNDNNLNQASDPDNSDPIIPFPFLPQSESIPDDYILPDDPDIYTPVPDNEEPPNDASDGITYSHLFELSKR
ncbi:hypothetical protein K435DRAFT_863959 [Dendrothele bispora CBS 962.96]|uniref:Uncharacterized protein n=1 Tax=Dendrothele bispora (strain CBS 962.96) TaxID=1314807 RepID=A0A4S8LNA0_DENBC|nr:hypothetical protein K435DRAFT_863959 [Dendrothele bispora CBS 962.96]